MRDTVLFLAHVPTEALNRGFLPAAQSMGLKVILLTDQAATHHHYFSQPDLPAYPEQILQCDVFNPLSVSIFSQNSRPPWACFPTAITCRR